MKRYNALSDVLLEARAREQRIQFIDSDKDVSELTTAQLYDAAVALLHTLQQRGMQAGDELVIFTRSNRQFAVAFWAAVLGGIVPVPVAVGISDEHRFKLFRILRQLARPQLLTETDLHTRLVSFAAAHGDDEIGQVLATRALIGDTDSDGQAGQLATPSADDVAFIQYSSGSTGDPKGVCLTHANVCINIRAIVEGAKWDATDRALSWMPLTHDMGLIGYHLSVLAAGMDHAIMDTSAFVRRPLLWMIKASEFRATQLCSPNFGYKHFLKLFERKGLPDGIDLSGVKLILNGAEPISVDLCERFLHALAPLGLRPETMFPVYGMAEATVGVSMGSPGTPYESISVDRHHLAIAERTRTLAHDHPDAVQFVNVGRAIRDVEVRIVDDHDTCVGDSVVGHIQLRGGSVTQRIYGDTQTTAALFAGDQWLRTGDCGMFVAQDLYITGRQKDLIILNGQNYYPHDLEMMLEHVSGLELGKVVVAGAGVDAANDTESLLVFVLHRGDAQDVAPLAAQVRQRLGESAGLEVDHVIPVSRIPKTTSGKVQRRILVDEYVAGDYAQVIALVTPAGQPSSETGEADPLLSGLLGICNEFSAGVAIGPDDNLFEVGVSSLTLSEIVLGIDEKYPGMLDISELFDVPTVREITALLRDKGAA